MSIFAPSHFGDTTGFYQGTCSTFGYTNYIYCSSSNIDIRGNKHVDLHRMAELQKLVAKNPNRADLKMELMTLQKIHKPKIGKRKKKK